ncbi:hypothetical protein BDQ17DRAFT_1364376 [Cyathus striatus]|nr:hypothetical protein BDQ17DRAFT_1364376 [Cyathus striatus]
MFLTHPSDVFFWYPLHMVLDQLYTITTLIILNSRTVSRERGDSVVEMSFIDFSPADGSV